MRFLRTVVREQIRLGWLSVIAGLVGIGRRDLQTLRTDLLALAPKFAEWASFASLLDGPQGNISQARADRLVRIGITYGIYNQDVGMLTDIGHVLRFVAPWDLSSSSSPLVWEGAKRWIGLQILMQTAGDMVLTVFKYWNTPQLYGRDATDLIVSALKEIWKRASNDDREQLSLQMVRSIRNDEYVRQNLTYPYLEPLRDLGYVQHLRSAKGSVGYELTTRGRRIQQALARMETDADALLKQGISKVFLHGEGFENVIPANGKILARVLAELPNELKVNSGEAPLDAVVSIAQARLIAESPGEWIDHEYAHALIRAVELKSGGVIFLKNGQSVEELNIAWNPSDLVENIELWDTSGAFIEQASAKLSEELQPQSDRHAADTTTGVRASAESTDAMPPTGPGEENTETVEPVPHPTPSSISGNSPYYLLYENSNGNLHLWLQYVTVLLSSPLIGAIDLSRWGGLVTGLSRLNALLLDLPPERLKEKRKPTSDATLGANEAGLPVCVTPLKRIKETQKSLQCSWLIERVLSHWTNEHLLPLPAITRGLSISTHILDEFRERIEKFIDNPSGAPDWDTWNQGKDRIQEATRCLVHDSLTEGIWSSETLLGQLIANLSNGSPRQTATWILDSLTARFQQYTYQQSLEFQESDAALLQLNELVEDTKGDAARGEELEVLAEKKDPDSVTVTYQVQVHVLARSWHEARRLGRSRVHSLLVSRDFEVSSPFRDRSVELPTKLSSEDVWDTESGSSLVVAGTVQEGTGLLFTELCPPIFPQASGSSIGWRDILAAADGPVSDHRQHRLVQAIRGFALARDPVRSPAERLVLAWTAMEQLVANGESSKSAALPCLAAAASLLQFKHEFLRVYRDAMAALIAAFTLAPKDQNLEQSINQWLPDINAELLLLRDIPNAIRRSRLFAHSLPKPTAIDADEAINRLWKNRDSIIKLREGIEKISPLAAAGLHHFYRITGNGAASPAPLGDGTRIRDHFLHIYEDTLSFLSHVYEIRNRFVHSGEGLDARYEPATQDMHDRFCALTGPVLAALLSRLQRPGTTIHQAWQLAQDHSHDLATLAKPSPGNNAVAPALTRFRLLELLSF